MTLVVGSVDIYLVMAGAQNLQQRNIASLGFHVDHELLLQVVAIDVLLGRLHEPVTDIVPVNAPKLCFRNVNLSCLVILAYVGSIGELNSSVLNFCAGVIKVPRGQFVTLGIGMGPVKSPIAESVDDTQIVHARREPNIGLLQHRQSLGPAKGNRLCRRDRTQWHGRPSHTSSEPLKQETGTMS